MSSLKMALTAIMGITRVDGICSRLDHTVRYQSRASRTYVATKYLLAP